MSPMKYSPRHATSDTSFLPEDYVEQRAERRTNIISLTLFAVVMIAVIAAFLVTNQQWNTVKTQQQGINVAYTNAAQEIEQLELLQEQQEKMMHKAELTAALIERVPRSILLAELINRMPDNVSLLEFQLEQKEPKRRRASSQTHGVRDLSGKKNQRPTKQEANPEETRIDVPRYQTELQLLGVAPTDVEVSEYIASLNRCELLSSVTLKYSENSMVEDRLMREFRIHMLLNRSADARHIEPLVAQRSIESQRAAEDLVFGELPAALRESDQGDGASSSMPKSFSMFQKAYEKAKDHADLVSVDPGEGGD